MIRDRVAVKDSADNPDGTDAALRAGLAASIRSKDLSTLDVAQSKSSLPSCLKVLGWRQLSIAVEPMDGRVVTRALWRYPLVWDRPLERNRPVGDLYKQRQGDLPSRAPI